MERVADETFETLGAPGALLGTHMTSWTTDDADYDAALALLAPNIGLRIGKSSANPSGKSDAGMDLDGQYFHYLDKALFASAVLAEEAGDDAGTRHALRAAAIILAKDDIPVFVSHKMFFSLLVLLKESK